MPSSILLFLHLGVGQIQLRRNHSGCRIVWHLLTQFSLSRASSPSSPRVTNTSDNLGAELSFEIRQNYSQSKNTNRTFFINWSNKTSIFPVSLTPLRNRQFGAPLAHQLVQGHCHLFQLEMMLSRKYCLDIFWLKKSTVMQLNWNERCTYTSSLPSTPFFSWS